MKTKILLQRASLALILSAVMVAGLVFNSRQAAALEAVLDAPSASSVSPGTTVTFNAAIRFTNGTEIIPISSLELVLSGPTGYSINFGPLSLAATGNTSVLSVIAGPQTAFGAGYGYAFGYATARFGYVAGYGYRNFGAGYGYGTVGAFSGGVGYIRAFEYTFAVNTTTLTPGTYTLTFNVNTGSSVHPQFSSAQRSFSVTGGGGGGSIPTSPVPSASAAPSATAPPAATAVPGTPIGPVIDFKALAGIVQAGTAGGSQTITLTNSAVTVTRDASGNATSATITVGSGSGGTATVTIPVNASGQVTGTPTLTVVATSSGNIFTGAVTVTSSLGSIPTTGTSTIRVASESQLPPSDKRAMDLYVFQKTQGTIRSTAGSIVGSVVFDHPGITDVGQTEISYTFNAPVDQGNAAVALSTLGQASVGLRVFDSSSLTLGSDLITTEETETTLEDTETGEIVEAGSGKQVKPADKASSGGGSGGGNSGSGNASGGNLGGGEGARPSVPDGGRPDKPDVGRAIKVTQKAKSASTFTLLIIPELLQAQVPTATTTPAPTVTAAPTIAPTTPPAATATPRPGSVGDVSFSTWTLLMLLASGAMMLMLATVAIKKAWRQP